MLQRWLTHLWIVCFLLASGCMVACVSSHRASVKAKTLSDKDNDGVPDAKDLCPVVAGVKRYKGCPLYADVDDDGFDGTKDKCPFVKGALRNHGCPWPDTDKDGIKDYIDACPKQFGTSANYGCPKESNDIDNDGVPNQKDKCMTKPGPKAFKGCPLRDSDGDGILDHLDDCPDIPGQRKDEKGRRTGCPILSPIPVTIPPKKR